MRLLSSLPDSCESILWPCFKETLQLQEPEYWLDADELVLLAALAGLNVAIFTRHASKLALRQHYVQDSYEIILLVMDGGRAHFERLELETEESRRHNALWIDDQWGKAQRSKYCFMECCPGPGKLRNLIAIAIAKVKLGCHVRIAIAIAIVKLEVRVKIAISIS